VEHFDEGALLVGEHSLEQGAGNRTLLAEEHELNFL
jgi:hypothetical protein